MLGLEAVNGDHQVQPRQKRPRERDGSKSTGDQLDKNSQPFQSGEEDFHFPEPDQWVSTDDGEVEWAVSPHQGQHALDQRLSLKVGELSQIGTASQMPILVGITPRTVERTFPGDFNGKGWKPTLQDSSPGMHHFDGLHTSPLWLNLDRTGLHLPHPSRTPSSLSSELSPRAALTTASRGRIC